MCASDIELESIKHVAFEVASVERWADLFLEGGGRCRFEVFLLHSRLLREFLWVNSDDRYPQDLRAEQFFDDRSEWRSVRGPLPPVLDRTKDPIDQQLAHLSRSRATDFQSLEPEVPEIRSAITAQFDRFLELLEPGLKQSFEEALSENRELLSRSQ